MRYSSTSKIGGRRKSLRWLVGGTGAVITLAVAIAAIAVAQHDTKVSEFSRRTAGYVLVVWWWWWCVDIPGP
jgi:hypothetical protein